MEKLLKLIEKNPMLTPDKLAAMLDRSEAEVSSMIEDLTQKGVIKGYRTLIDWEKVSNNHVKALIELKVSPKKGQGFDEVAKQISEMREVESVTLISGSYDLLVEIKAKTFQEIAMLVAQRLSPLDDIISTATHFVLKPYKQSGVIYNELEKDERRFSSLW